MSRTTAHFVIGAFDLAALVAVYHVFSEWQAINQQLLEGAVKITFQSFFPLYGLMLMVPLIHGLGFFNWKGGTQQWANRGVIALVVLLVVVALGMNSILTGKLADTGYQYCEAQSTAMTFSTFKTYLKEGTPCLEPSNEPDSF